MARRLDAAEVAKHNTSESCWVILYGKVYDVTDFLARHPGGSEVVLQLAGTDATASYDPVHPPGTLEGNLAPSQVLGEIDPDTLPKPAAAAAEEAHLAADEARPPLDRLLNLDDVEELATKTISRKAWSYYFSAGDDLISKTLNNTAYRSILLRPRIFVDCSQCDLSTTFFGHVVSLPIYVSPTAMARLAHPSGERGVAQACAKYGALQIISNNASMTPEQIVEGARPGQIFGWQLYAQTDVKKSEAMLARINKMRDRFKFICLTLDAPVPGKREHDERSKNIGSKLAVTSAAQQGSAVRPGGGGIGQQLFFGTDNRLTWESTLPWLAKHTDLPIVLKGIQTHEDAYQASRCAPQVRGIILSNHGGRAADTAPPAVHTLLEIRKYCPEVLQRVEVYVDGGIKRGTDVVKALCLGARGVGVGRAALWGLGAGGAEGVERVLEILRDELKTVMQLLGAERVADLRLQHVNTRALEQQIYDGPAALERPKLAVSSKL